MYLLAFNYGACSLFFPFLPTGKPWTFQYLVQHLMSKSRLFPVFLNGCCCNKETLSKKDEAGFEMVQAEKVWLDCTPEMFSECSGTFTLLCVRMFMMPVLRSMIVGFAEKGKISGLKTDE